MRSIPQYHVYDLDDAQSTDWLAGGARCEAIERFILADLDRQGITCPTVVLLSDMRVAFGISRKGCIMNVRHLEAVA